MKGNMFWFRLIIKSVPASQRLWKKPVALWSQPWVIPYLSSSSSCSYCPRFRPPALYDDLKENNVRGYNDMTNRMNAIRSSYKAGGLNLGQYEHDDDDDK